MFPLVIGDGDELRLLTMDHARELFDLVDKDRDELCKWLPWVDGTRGPEQTAAFIEQGQKKLLDNNGFEAGIFCQDQLAGVIGVHYIDWTHGQTAIGYWLGTEFWGLGLVSRACRAVTECAFTVWGLHRVEIRCAVDNQRSRAVPLRLGFEQEGVLRQAEKVGDALYDLVVYGMIRDEWK